MVENEQFALFMMICKNYDFPLKITLSSAKTQSLRKNGLNMHLPGIKHLSPRENTAFQTFSKFLVRFRVYFVHLRFIKLDFQELNIQLDESQMIKIKLKRPKYLLKVWTTVFSRGKRCCMQGRCMFNPFLQKRLCFCWAKGNYKWKIVIFANHHSVNCWFLTIQRGKTFRNCYKRHFTMSAGKQKRKIVWTIHVYKKKEWFCWKIKIFCWKSRFFTSWKSWFYD